MRAGSGNCRLSGTVVGSALGAPFILWLGMGRALLFSGLLMMFSNVMFMLLAMVGFVSTVAYCKFLLRGDIIE